MSTIGEIERQTQRRVIDLFRNTLGYEYLGNWGARPDNRNLEMELLRSFLRDRQGYDDSLMVRALHLLEKAANDSSKSVYDRNRSVYELLRYGVKVKLGAGENTQTVWLIDWKHPDRNHFAIAEEVSVNTARAQARTKRPDLVLYVNGIALGVLELKRSTVSVEKGIHQNLDNQKKVFIESFFATIQLVLAGSETEGVRYGTIGTKAKYYLTWKEPGEADNLLALHLTQLCSKPRLLELVHDFTVFDAGTKKLCRHNQYFAVRAAQAAIKRREGGIIWNSQGSGKSLIMVWLTKWLRENATNARVLLITDRTELDEQIEKVFKGVNEEIYRTTSGADLVARLNATNPWLICSLIHKFSGRDDREDAGDVSSFLADIRKALPPDFSPKGDLYVLVDECHRTQSGELHKAMKAILPHALFIGFTGTPLLKSDKQRSVEVFGRYIHTYKFDEAVEDGVILDLRYEARKIDQNITSQAKIDQWFEVKTKGLTDLAKARLKQRWGTIQKVLSSQSRLEKIVADILMDMETRDRLKSGHGNALLVSGSIYQACKFYELFAKTDLKGKCAIITSYKPSASDIKGEETGEGLTEKLRQYEIYRQMLAEWFDEPPDVAESKVEEFEKAVKSKFIEAPGQMKLLIVVDKLLTGFDSPPATYLYIDKHMQNHGLFQAICRVNRLDGEDKEYGYIIDYKDLFDDVKGAMQDYTSGALDGYDKEDVAGLLENRLVKAREHLEEARESIRALCEPVEPPKDQRAYFRYFSGGDSGNGELLKENEPKRLALYKLAAALVRAYAAIANELEETGYTPPEIVKLKAEVTFYENLRNEVKQHSGDAIDLKRYEPAMRHLIDTYIRAEESEKLSALDDLSLVQLIVEKGVDSVKALPEGIRQSREAVAETIENNVRKLIIDEQPINPKYYERMSELLEALIQQRKQETIEYQRYLEQIVELTKQAKSPQSGGQYPPTCDTSAKGALYDNLDRNEAWALRVDAAVRENLQDDWRNHPIKVRKVRAAIRKVLEDIRPPNSVSIPEGYAGNLSTPPLAYGSEVEDRVDEILNLVKNQNEY